MNASFDGRPARFEIGSEHVVLIDPLALDGLAQQLIEIETVPGAERHAQLQALGRHGLRIGVQSIRDSAPGMYEVDLESFEAAEPTDTSPTVFDIDTGTVIIIDGDALAAVARSLTWDRYDALLQAPVNDFSLPTETNREVGGARFAIVAGDADKPFSGDGAFRLTENGLIPVI